MTKIDDYTIQKLADDKHTKDGIHGKDSMYDAAFESVKDTVDKVKQTPEYVDKLNTGFVGTIDEMDKAIKTIEDVRNGHIDTELIEEYIRKSLKKLAKNYNEIIEEM